MQPFNWAATTIIHGVFRVFGFRSEAIVKHLHRTGHVRAKLPNEQTLRLWSRADDWISTQVFWKGWNAYESETIEVFFRLASSSKVVFDVGAHIGLFALVAGHANKDAQVFAFEPVSESYERLRHNVRLNGLSNVHCIQRAVSDHEGSAPIFHQPGLAFTASMSRDFMNWQNEWSATEVDLTTIDQFIEDNQISQIDLIKIDTESTEAEVLRGMARSLERHHPHIVCEVLPGLTEQDLTTILAPFGYHYYQITDRGLIWKDEIAGDLKFRNYLFSTLLPEQMTQIVPGLRP